MAAGQLEAALRERPTSPAEGRDVDPPLQAPRMARNRKWSSRAIAVAELRLQSEVTVLLL